MSRRTRSRRSGGHRAWGAGGVGGVLALGGAAVGLYFLLRGGNSLSPPPLVAADITALPNGASCRSDAVCASGYCVNGTCVSKEEWDAA